MEFVEGETLEKLIRRSGLLKVKLALEIVSQVAAGLAAIHQQNAAWANKDVNVVTIFAWAGAGKSTLVNHWLRRMAMGAEETQIGRT